MAAEKDDRLSGFVDITGMNADKESVLNILNEVKAAIQDANKAKLAVFDSNTIRKLTEHLKVLNDTLSKVNKTRMDANRLVIEEARIRKINADAAAKEALAEKNRADARAKILKQEIAQEREKRMQQQQAAREQARTTSTNNNVNAGNQLNSLYKDLREQLTALEKEAKELASKQFMGIASQGDIQRLGQLKTQIDDLALGIHKIDQQYTRAGVRTQEYARQLFSLQQILREVPSAAFGFSTFIAAISNNIPILVDDIQRIRKENQLLAASGQATTSVWTSLRKSFFSWQTLILAGVSIIAIYADEIANLVKELLRTAEANRRAYMESKKYADVQKQISDALEKITASFIRLAEVQRRSTEDGIRHLKRELEVMQALGVSANKLFKIKEDIANLEKTSADNNKQTTAAAVASQFDLIGVSQLSDNRQELKFLEQEAADFRDKAGKANNVRTFSTAGGGTGTSTTAKSAEQIADEKALADLFTRRVEFKKKEIALDEQGINIAKQLRDRMAEIDRQYYTGLIDLTQKTNAQLLAENEFLLRAKDLQNQKQINAEQNSQALEQERIRQLNRVNRKRKDPSKDKGVQNANGLAEAAADDVKSAENTYKQIDEAFERSNDAQAELDRLKNEKIKFNSDEARKRALANAEAVAGKTIAANEDILASDTATLEEKKKALAQIRKATDDLIRAQRSDTENDLGASPADIESARKRAETELEKNRISHNRKILDLEQEYKERRLNAIQEELEAEIEMRDRVLDIITSSQEESLRNRLLSEKEAFEARRRLLEGEFKKELSIAGLSQAEIDSFAAGNDIILTGKRKTVEELLAMRARFENSIQQLTIESADKQLQILAQELERNKTMHERHVQVLETIYGKFQLETLKGYSQEVIELNNSLIRKEVTYRNYLLRRTKLDREYEKESRRQEASRIRSTLQFFNNADADASRTLQELNAAQKKAQDAPVGSQERADALKELELARKAYELALWFLREKQKLEEQATNLEKEDSENDVTLTIEKRQARMQAIFDTMAATLQLLDSIANRGFTLRTQQLDQEMSLMERRNRLERESIEQQITNETEKNKKLAELRVREESQQNQIEQRRRKLEYDRAKFQKISALFGIALDTARGIVAANASPITMPLVPFIIAAGAIQAAAVLAQPLPKYARGRKGGPAETAIVGDGGRSELIETPDGKMYVTGNTPETVSLGAGDIVHPDAEAALKAKMADASRKTDAAIGVEGGVIEIYGIDKLQSTMKSGFTELNKTIKAKPEMVFKRDINKDLLMRYGLDYHLYL